MASAIDLISNISLTRGLCTEASTHYCRSSPYLPFAFACHTLPGLSRC